MQAQIDRLIDQVTFNYREYNGRIAAGYQRQCPTVYGLEYYATAYAPYHDIIAVQGHATISDI